MDNKPAFLTSDNSDLSLLHLKLVAKLALITGVGAVGLLMVMAGLVASEADTDYFQIIQAHTITRQHIAPAMLLTTLLLLAMVGLSAGIIGLFSSFRVAGPLYRFRHILQEAKQPVPAYHLRRKDSLQGVSHDLQKSVEHLHAHYQKIRSEVDDLLSALNETQSGTSSQYQKAIQNLKQLEAELQFYE